MTAIRLNAEVWPGTPIESACEQLVRLAKQLDTEVLADFNGVTLIAQPHGTADALRASWEVEMKLDRQHKIATSRTVARERT